MSPFEDNAALEAIAAPLRVALADLDESDFVRRLWARDASLWSDDPAVQATIADRLGWLDSPEAMRGRIDELAAFAQELRDDGFTHAVLLGMGGSSLAPEVLRDTFGATAAGMRLIVLDSTDPDAVRAVEEQIDLPRVLFIASSKSGGTVETVSFLDYFWALSGDGSQFAVITDPGSSLERLAEERGFRRAFLNPPDIGGRYSALSYVGLVPAALLGIDLGRLLDRAVAMLHACGREVAAAENPGVSLGAALGGAAREGRDKLTLVCSPAVASFAYWTEQLVAESTGKEGRGILPVEGEPLGPPEVYGDDRLFVALTLRGDTDEQDARLDRLAAAGQPVVRLALDDAYDLGGEFVRWEIATATAGALLRLNPFDEPSVQEAKDATKRLLAGYEATGSFDEGTPLRADGLTIYAPPALADVSAEGAVFGELFAQLGPGSYVALLAFFPRTDAHDRRLAVIRAGLRDQLQVAVTAGYGPRYLHSTGQLHKGGPPTGAYLILTADHETDLPVPGRPFSFGVLEQAQALGDLQTLHAHDLPAVRVHLGDDIDGGLERLAGLLGLWAGRRRA